EQAPFSQKLATAFKSSVNNTVTFFEMFMVLISTIFLPLAIVVTLVLLLRALWKRLKRRRL
ncbi:hypothetical protein LJB89_03840, partial [Tyzzerella sp. OttesenSCG-928-J15]|nr:hypothetical protein [Tyzzerella sp. OttesenSCG-928-J15]